ncbi:MAG: DUF1064 domain-containing protein [Elusimicrobia bacterium]|nr:DUF1064 domain-containing protein [Elusimicrobiota bacterium]
MYTQCNKWGSAKKTIFSGYRYDSKFEAGYAQELDLRQKAGEILKWEKQIKIPLVVNNYIVCNYYIDFIVYYPNGEIEYVETKGYATPLWRLKWKLFEALFSEKPNVKLLVIKQKSNWTIRKLKKIKS